MIAALRTEMGIVTQASKKSGIPARTHYGWLEADPSYALEVDEMKEMQIDFAESALLRRIQEGSDASIIFFLKTQARHRGYIERKDITIGTEQVFVVSPEQKGLQSTIKRIEDANEVQDD